VVQQTGTGTETETSPVKPVEEISQKNLMFNKEQDIMLLPPVIANAKEDNVRFTSKV